MAQRVNAGNFGKESIDKYRDTIFPYPKGNVSPKVKESPEYILAQAQALWSDYVSNRCAIPYSYTEGNYDFHTLRLFAKGKQPEGLYKKMLGREYGGLKQGSKDPSDDDFAKLAMHSLDYSIVSECPRYIDALLGVMTGVKTMVSVTSQDDYSNEQRAEMKLAAMEMMRNEFYKKLVEGNLLAKGQLPSGTEKEIDFKLKHDESFVLKHERALQITLNYCFENLSSYDEEIFPEMVRDALTLGWTITKDETDPYTHQAHAKYIDPERAVIPYSDSRYYRNITRAAHVEWMSLSDVMRQLKGKNNLKEKDENDIIKFFETNKGQYNYWSGRSGSFNKASDGKIFRGTAADNMRVPVLCGEFKEWNQEKYISRPMEGNVDFRKNVALDYTPADNETEMVAEHECWYEYTWLIGTEWLLNYGRRNWDLNNKGKTFSSYSACMVSETSMVEQMIPILNFKQISWLQHQDEWVRKIPSGVQVDVTMLLNALKDKTGSPVPPNKLIELAMGKGIMLYQTPVNPNNPRYGRKDSPYKINDTTAGIINMVAAYVSLNEELDKKLTQITGITPDLLGSSAKPDQLVGVTEMMIAGTHNRLKPIFDGLMHVKENLAKNMALRIQMAARHSEMPLYPEIDEYRNLILQVGREMWKYQFGVKIKIVGTELRRKSLMDIAGVALKEKQIRTSDYNYILHKIENDEYDAAEQYLRIKEELYEQSRIEEQKYMVELSAKENAQSAQRAIEGQAFLAQLDGQIKGQLVQIENQMQGQTKAMLEQVRGMVQKFLDDNSTRNQLVLQDDEQKHEKEIAKKNLSKAA